MYPFNTEVSFNGQMRISMSKSYETLMEGKQELKSAILKLEERIISPTESYQRF